MDERDWQDVMSSLAELQVIMEENTVEIQVSLGEGQVSVGELQANVVRPLYNERVMAINSRITSQTTQFRPLHDPMHKPIPGFPMNMRHLQRMSVTSCRRILLTVTGAEYTSHIEGLSAGKCRNELMFEIGVDLSLKGSDSGSRKKRKFKKQPIIDLNADESDDEIRSKRSLGVVYLDRVASSERHGILA